MTVDCGWVWGFFWVHGSFCFLVPFYRFWVCARSAVSCCVVTLPEHWIIVYPFCSNNFILDKIFSWFEGRKEAFFTCHVAHWKDKETFVLLFVQIGSTNFIILSILGILYMLYMQTEGLYMLYCYKSLYRIEQWVNNVSQKERITFVHAEGGFFAWHFILYAILNICLGFSSEKGQTGNLVMFKLLKASCWGLLSWATTVLIVRRVGHRIQHHQ